MARRATYKNSTYEKRYKKKQCIKCGEAPRAPKKKECEKCSSYSVMEAQNLRDSRTEAGMCPRCGRHKKYERLECCLRCAGLPEGKIEDVVEIAFPKDKPSRWRSLLKAFQQVTRE